MGRGRVTALMIAVVVIGLALMRTATASFHQSAFSGGATFKGLVVKTNVSGVSVSGVFANWTTVDSRGFQIPAGESQLIVGDFFAQTVCAGSAGNCLVRMLVGRTLGTAVELHPGAPNTPLAIDTVGGAEAEGHAFAKALCVRNNTASPLDISVWVQATKSQAEVSTFNLSNTVFKIARNAPCSPFVDI